MESVSGMERKRKKRVSSHEAWVTIVLSNGLASFNQAAIEELDLVGGAGVRVIERECGVFFVLDAAAAYRVRWKVSKSGYSRCYVMMPELLRYVRPEEGVASVSYRLRRLSDTEWHIVGMVSGYPLTAWEWDTCLLAVEHGDGHPLLPREVMRGYWARLSSSQKSMLLVASLGHSGLEWELFRQSMQGGKYVSAGNRRWKVSQWWKGGGLGLYEEI